MKSQDERLNKLGENYAAQKALEKQKEAKLKEKENFLKEIQGENQKVNTVIAAYQFSVFSFHTLTLP